MMKPTVSTTTIYDYSEHYGFTTLANLKNTKWKVRFFPMKACCLILNFNVCTQVFSAGWRDAGNENNEQKHGCCHRTRSQGS